MAAPAWLWKGHLFQFDREPARPAHHAAAGVRILAGVVALEAVRWTINLPRFHPPRIWLQIPLFLALGLLLVPLCGLRFRDVGFRRWAEWTRAEKSYFIQVLLIANAVFPLIFAARLRAVVAGPGTVAWLLTVFVPYLFFGFYQELVYRGLLQTELVRRWGPAAGIAGSNLLFTFGPLHAVYFGAGAGVAIPMFAGVFAIGLLFALVFRRSGNLWIVAVMHAIGNAYIVGSGR